MRSSSAFISACRARVEQREQVGDLLALAPEDAAHRIKASHINAGVIKDWQAQALLACSVPELNGTNAQLLVGAGVYSIDDLATADLYIANRGHRVLGLCRDARRVAFWVHNPAR